MIRSWAPYALPAVSIWLAWHVVTSLLVFRAPPELAMRASPDSPTALRRLAESAYSGERFEDADILARAALQRAPFDVRSLRVAGLVAARNGNVDQADNVLTLAGNWSLRDDPSHAWLIEHRLRQGQYGSAFAHADTLARRRPDLRKRLYQFFDTAVLHDQRSLPALAQLVAAHPPWRDDYFFELKQTADGPRILATLAIALEKTSGRFSDAELQELYAERLARRDFGTIRAVRDAIHRPDDGASIVDPEFSAPGTIKPFGWVFSANAGISAEVVDDDLRPNEMALRVESDGFSPARIADQLVLLSPGAYTLSGQYRFETEAASPSLSWSVRCGDSSIELGRWRPTADASNPGWRNFAVDFVVPAECAAQWISLANEAGNRRSTVIVWFDKFAIRSRGASGAGA